MKLSFLLALGALACTSNVRADSIDELATQIQYDQTHITPVESELLKEKHMAQMRQDIQRRLELVDQDKQDYLKELQTRQSGPSWAQHWQSRADNLAKANQTDSSIKIADALGGAHPAEPSKVIIQKGPVTEVYGQ